MLEKLPDDLTGLVVEWLLGPIVMLVFQIPGVFAYNGALRKPNPCFLFHSAARYGVQPLLATSKHLRVLTSRLQYRVVNNTSTIQISPLYLAPVRSVAHGLADFLFRPPGEIFNGHHLIIKGHIREICDTRVANLRILPKKWQVASGFREIYLSCNHLQSVMQRAWDCPTIQNFTTRLTLPLPQSEPMINMTMVALTNLKDTLRYIECDMSELPIAKRIQMTKMFYASLHPRHSDTSSERASLNGALEIDLERPSPCKQCGRALNYFGGIPCDAPVCTDHNLTCMDCIEKNMRYSDRAHAACQAVVPALEQHHGMRALVADFLKPVVLDAATSIFREVWDRVQKNMPSPPFIPIIPNSTSPRNHHSTDM